MTVRVIVIHRVDDYDRWKEHFDAAADLRAAAGETEYEVLRSTGDPNLVVHAATWSSDDDARAFFESPKVAQIRADAGVEPPLFLYLDPVDSGILVAPPVRPSLRSVESSASERNMAPESDEATDRRSAMPRLELVTNADREPHA